jgi:hypothetical protein
LKARISAATSGKKDSSDARIPIFNTTKGLGILVLLLILCILDSRAVNAQSPDTTISRATSLARFQDARALAVDARGQLYVVDAGTDKIYRLNSEGRVLNQLGGRGSGNYQFDEPVDIDPTNGLDIFVADSGNNRVQHFSSELRFLDTRDLQFETNTSAQIAGYYSTNADYSNKLIISDGTPMAISANVAKEIFAIDQSHSFIVKWDAEKRVERQFARFDAGDAAVLDGVSMVSAPNGHVFIADRGRGAIMEYDHNGNYIRRMGSGQLKQLNAVSLFGDRIMAVMSNKMAVYDSEGKLLFTYGFNFGENVMDVVYAHRNLYVLTSTKLMRFRP